MEEEQVSVPATLLRKKKENENLPGVITMTPRKFMFTPNDSRFLSAHKIDVEMGNITVQYGVKAKVMMRVVHDSTNKADIFELDNAVDGDSCRAYTSKYVGIGPRDKDAALVEIKQKVTLLEKNQEHLRLHGQLVTGNIIKEDEFWSKRKKLLQAVACEPTNQQTGLKSDMLSHIQLMSGLQTENAQIKSEIIQLIFTEKPIVLREFLKKVPNPMKEPEFWKKFLTAESYRRRENIALGRAEASVDRQLAIFLKDDDIVADEVQHKIGSVDPTVDMVEDFSDDYTHLEGHGILVRGNGDNVGVVTDNLQEALFHDINRHAIIVLEGRAIDSKVHNTTEIAKALDKIQRAKKNIKIGDELIQKYRIQKANKMVEINDLQMLHEFYVPLHVKDSCQYSASQKANAVDVHEHMDVDPSNFYADLQKISLKINNKGLNNPIVKSNLTFKKMVKSLESDAGDQLSLLLQPMLQAIEVATQK